jgi:hypothetical protein
LSLADLVAGGRHWLVVCLDSAPRALIRING